MGSRAATLNAQRAPTHMAAVGRFRGRRRAHAGEYDLHDWADGSADSSD